MHYGSSSYRGSQLRSCLYKIIVFTTVCSKACFKIAFWQLCVPLCGRFDPDEGRVAGYVT
ncbi:DUF6783 domain-containing protein [Robinsoniella peoriensis]|uniref:DUF6783 domain-containing protein n=1 Tax=Robinsoniella peoriensis TaxID=180332 RepID=UPI0037501289